MKKLILIAAAALLFACGPKAPLIVRPSIQPCPENARIEEMHVADESELILHCILLCFHPDETLPVTYWRVHIASHIFVPADEWDELHGLKAHTQKKK